MHDGHRTLPVARWTRTRSLKAVASMHHCLALGYDSFLHQVFTTAAVRHAATRICMCAVTDLGKAVTKLFESLRARGSRAPGCGTGAILATLRSLRDALHLAK